MSVATGSTISITRVLPAGIVTTYTTDVSLYIVYNGITKRYNVTVVNSTAVAAGSLTVNGVVLTEVGLHVCTFSHESSTDLDTNGIVITPIATGSISAVTMQTTVAI